jgi:hypothetical protein
VRHGVQGEVASAIYRLLNGIANQFDKHGIGVDQEASRNQQFPKLCD